jgi:hypothetical protein
MDGITSEEQLKLAIAGLEAKQSEEGKVLKEQFLETFEAIKPINIIKNTLHDAAESQDIKVNILKTAVGLTTGFIAQSVMQNVADKPEKKLLVMGLTLGAVSIVAEHPDIVKSVFRTTVRTVLGLMHSK